MRFVTIVVLLLILTSWIWIPGEIDPITGISSKHAPSTGVPKEPSGLQIMSFAFADGFLVGWADELAIKIFYSDSNAMKETAQDAFRNATILGEEKYPTSTMIFLLFGTIFSIGALIAVQMARSADNSSEAFKLGFFAEIAESVAYHTGYYSTMQKSALSAEEIVVTVAVAFLTGFAASFAFKKYHK